MEDLRVLACITSDDTRDPSCVPFYSEGVCRHFGAFPDSPLPDARVFVVFNREPTTEEEAHETTRVYITE